MNCIPVTTREMYPPKDNLFELLDQSLPPICDRDIILITSKVVSIHQGRCVGRDTVDKHQLVRQEADSYIEDVFERRTRIIATKHHAISLYAGVDPYKDYYILLPKQPNQIAAEIRSYLIKKYHIRDLGIIITDSHSMPLRRGVMCYGVGFAGIHPLLDRGGRNFAKWTSNAVDAIAAYGGIYLGESAQLSHLTPVVIMRGVDFAEFTDGDHADVFFTDDKKDLYSPLLRHFQKPRKKLQR